METSFLAYLASGVLGIGLLQWRFRKTRKEFGSAAWLNTFQAQRRGLFKKKGLLVGDWTGLLPVHYDGTHAITFGSAGSGKGTTVIIPNLLRNNFIFLNDPGGENTAVAIKSWRERGLKIHIINPFRMFRQRPYALPAHGFNPFAFLNPKNATFVADAKVCAQLLIQRSPREFGSSKYFTDRAEAFIHAAIVHILTAEPKERRHPGTLYDYAFSSASEWEALLAAMKANKTVPLIRNMAEAMERMEAQSPGEFSAVQSTFQQSLQWLAEPLAREAVSRSQVDFKALKGHRGERGAVIAVVLPIEYKDSHKAIPRLAMQCAVWAMTRGPVAREKVVFEIDEAGSLGRLEPLPQWLAELRKYRVRWSLHFQNVAQAKYHYEAEWQTFQGNAGLKRFVGVSDTETAKEASEFLGRATVIIRQPGRTAMRFLAVRELRSADEIMRTRAGEMIALIDNLPPARLRKTPYWDRPEFAGTYNPNPYRKGLKTAGPLAPVKALWGGVVHALAWVMTPDPIAAVLMAGALAFFLLRGGG